MTAFRKQLLTGIAAVYMAAGSLAAYAQTPAQTPPAGAPQKPDHAAMAARMKDRMAKRQAELHDKLKLSASQESAWNTYIARMKPADMPPRPDRNEMGKLSAPERMDRMLSMMKEHEKQLETRAAATKEFYAVLTPEQQKVFNGEFARGWGRHPGEHHGGHQGHRGDHMPPAGK
jgi:periplasmic protein CpxP/Spy